MILGRSDKLLSLEVLRFSAALMIVIFHYIHFFIAELETAEINYSMLFGCSLLGPIYRSGFYAVYLFWSLSGFIFFWKYRTSISSGVVSGYQFFIFRFSRLYPLHLATLLLVTVLQYIHIQEHGDVFIYPIAWAGPFISQLFMANQWFGPEPYGFNGPIWSVCVEVLVYLFFYVMLRFCGSSLFIHLLILVTSALGVHFHFNETIHNAIGCIAFFYAGGVIAIFVKYLSDEKATFRSYLQIFCVFAIISVGVGVWCVMSYLNYVQIKISCNVSFLVIFPFLIYLIVLFIRIPIALQKYVEISGNLTYASYLCHVPLQIIISLACHYFNKKFPIAEGWFFFSYLGGSFTLAYFVYYYFEKPAQDWIRQILLPARQLKIERISVVE